jgi:hypothetical protein
MQRDGKKFSIIITWLHGYRIALCFGFVLLCSCATQNSVHPNLPAETSFNQEAGRGGWLLVKLHLENGEELLFVVDTGSPDTVLDKSLETKLDKRLGTKKIHYGFYKNTTGGMYAAPRLFLGNTQLLTGDRILTEDLHQKISPGVAGILGIDCLRHYCVQFDFADRKLRFLDPDHPSSEDLGKPFPLTLLFGCVFTRADFFGQGHVFSRLDTGYIGGIDASVNPKQFRRILQKQKPVMTATAPAKTVETASIACFAKGGFGGETYTNLTIAEWNSVPWSAQTLIGLQFLARHLVTFDFPNRMMYLRQESVGPLSSGFFLSMEAEHFLVELEQKDQLPGLSNNPQGDLNAPRINSSGTYPFSQSFDFQKTGDTSNYHYTVVRASQDSPWKLQKTWRTDANENIVEEYHVP